MTPEQNPLYMNLIDAWLDGEATPEQTAQLSAWLKQDRENVRVFVKASHMHRTLREFAIADQAQAEQSPGSAMKAQRRVLKASKHNSRGLLVAVGLTACVLLGIGLYRFAQGPATGPGPALSPITLASASANVLVKRGAQTLPATQGFNLQPDDTVQVPTGGSASISYSDGTRVDLKPNSDATIQPRSQTHTAGKMLLLARGELDAAVAKQPAGQPFILETPLARATVLGTRLTLLADKNAARLDVAEGRVQFAQLRAADTFDVSSGGFVRFAQGSISSANAVRTAAAGALRVIDDHEGALNWSQIADSVPTSFALSIEQAHGGKKSLRVAYQLKKSDKDPYTEIIHPFTFNRGDRALRFAIFVVSGEATANWNIQFRLRNRSCWMINTGFLNALKPGWNEIELDLQQPPLSQAFGDPTPYTPATADALLFSICNGSATFFLDDFVIVCGLP